MFQYVPSKAGPAERIYPEWGAQGASEPCIKRQNGRCHWTAPAGFLDGKKQRRDNSDDEKTPEEAPWRES
jgi:hypothetical protein